MTAIKQTTSFDDSLTTLRTGAGSGLKVVTESAKSGLVQIRTSKFAELAKSSAKNSWSRFQETRNRPVGDLLPVGFFSGNQDVSPGSGVSESVNESAVVTLHAASGDIREHDDPEQAGGKFDQYFSYLPTAVIVAGLAILCILTVLTTGPVEQDKGSDTQIAIAKTSAAPVTRTAPATAANSELNAESAETRIVVKPASLAASVTPLVFEPDTGSSGQNPDPSRQVTAEVENQALPQALPPVQSVAEAAVATATVQPVPAVSSSEKVAADAVVASKSVQIETPAAELAQSKEAEMQLQMLLGENARLKQQMAELEDETLDLNSELLQMELTLAEASALAEPRQVVETRTVYNFVNVPVGGGVEVPRNSQYDPSAGSNYVDNSYVNNQYPGNDQYNDDQYMNDQYRNGSNGSPALIADMPAPEMGWAPDGQLMPPNHELYRDEAAMMNGAPDPYFDERAYRQEPGYGVESDELMYGNGADVQYGPANEPLNLRGYPPVNN